MSSMEFDPSTHQLTVRPDFEGERAKAMGVFLADIFTTGVTLPADLAPHNWQEVQKPIASDVSPAAMQQIMQQSGVQLDFRI